MDIRMATPGLDVFEIYRLCIELDWSLPGREVT